MEEGDNKAIAQILKLYRRPNGAIDFPVLFTIPNADRLPALYEQDFLKTTALVVGALAMAFDKMGGKTKATGVLVNNIAEEVLATAGEDGLSMEDLMLFLQNMVRGKYGTMDNISLPKFMNIFDEYRDIRWQEAVKIRDEKIAHWQGLGDASRTAKNDPLSEHMSNLSGKISQMKDALKDKREIETMKKADKFYEGKQTG